jgi:hypothetical protein
MLGSSKANVRQESNADISRAEWHVRFAPKAQIGRRKHDVGYVP